jgi:hypothetical protein
MKGTNTKFESTTAGHELQSTDYRATDFFPWENESNVQKISNREARCNGGATESGRAGAGKREAHSAWGMFSSPAYLELLGVGPGQLGELLDGDGATGGGASALELTPVDEVGHLLAALRHDVPRHEAVRHRAELRQ